MHDPYLYHLLRMVIASAICTSMIGFGLLGRRRDGSRRLLFAVAALPCSALTIATIMWNGYSVGANQTIEIVVAAGMLLIALPVVFFGWRGRRVGDHPHCRRCGFDLFGKPPESVRCNECGAELAESKSIVVGVHEKRRGLVLAGLFLLILGMMTGGEAGRQVKGQIDWYRMKPDWMLLADLESPTRHQRAQQVLLNELSSPAVSASRAEYIAQRVLQRAEAGKQDYLLNCVVDLINHCDLLTEATTRRAMRQILTFNAFWLPTNLVRGSAIPFRVFPAASSTGYGYNQKLSWKTTKDDYRIGSFAVPNAEISAVSNGIAQEPDWDGPVISLGDDWSKIPAGNVTISRHSTLAITVDFRGHPIVETGVVTAQAVGNVMSAQAAARVLVAPTLQDSAVTWSATVFTGGRTPAIRVERSTTATPVFARAAIVDANGRREIGTVSVVTDSGGLMPDAAFTLPSGDFTIELVPAPVQGAGAFDTRPILNQTIKITTIVRSPDAAP